MGNKTFGIEEENCDPGKERKKSFKTEKNTLTAILKNKDFSIE